ncbi:hypothetical protein [Streptomyces sp. NPDC047108]|uniref:hypothetical protein n=1 Tax=Streptomyces sp. NPDC047108 TaxID=3155025 RepID=UPI0033CEEB46
MSTRSRIIGALTAAIVMAGSGLIAATDSASAAGAPSTATPKATCLPEDAVTFTSSKADRSGDATQTYVWPSSADEGVVTTDCLMTSVKADKNTRVRARYEDGTCSDWRNATARSWKFVVLNHQAGVKFRLEFSEHVKGGATF